MASRYTEAQRTALRDAIASGILTFTVGDHSQTFQNLREMRLLLAEMDRQLDGTPTHRLIATNKGTR